MIKKLIALTIVTLFIIGCTPDETTQPAANPVEEAVENSEIEETVESAVPDSDQGEPANPDVTIVDPSGSVDLGQLTPEPPTEDGELIIQPAPGVPDPEVMMVQLAGEDLAERLNIDISEVTLVEVIAQEWPDSSLGCPDPNFMYLTVITPGFQILLEAQGQSYTYHTDMVQNVVLCVDGRPAE
jgi:hypothetical protein